MGVKSSITENQTSSAILLHTEMNVVSNEKCQAEYRNASRRNKLSLRNDQVCARGDLSIGSDSCNGDSGGPLVLFSTETGRYEAVGITSFGIKFCNSAVPGVYTRVFNFFDWIKVFMWESFKSKQSI